MTGHIIRRVIRRNAGGTGCLPVLLVMLSAIWLTIGIVSIRMAPAIWGGVLMAVLGTAFLASAVALLVQQQRRLGSGALDRHPLMQRLRPGAQDPIVRVVDEPRVDGRGNQRRALRFVSDGNQQTVIYPGDLERLLIVRGLRRSHPQIAHELRTRPRSARTDT